MQKWTKTIESQKEEIRRVQQGERLRQDHQLLHEQLLKQNWIFVKLMRKVSMKWKNWRDFRAQESTQLRGEDWSRIKILSLNSLARYKNFKMKLIVWMIQEIFQDAESVHSGHSHVTRQTAFFQPHPVPGGMLSRKDGPFKYLEHAW